MPHPADSTNRRSPTQPDYLEDLLREQIIILASQMCRSSVIMPCPCARQMDFGGTKINYCGDAFY